MPPAETGTYTQLTRAEFEEWLTRDLGFSRSEWMLKPGRGGVYQLFLSPTVAIEINSTTGAQDAVMGRGNASMKLWLVSRITGKVLNKKAMGQAHFARTLNWRENWKKGVERMKDAYLKAKGFYDRIAPIEDRDKYKKDTLALITNHPGWYRGDPLILELKKKVERGDILSEKQYEVFTSLRKPIVPTSNRPVSYPEDEDTRLRGLRELWLRANREYDEWTTDFVQSIGNQIKAGRTLSPKQEQILNEKAQYYGVRVASRLTMAQRVALRYATRAV